MVNSRTKSLGLKQFYANCYSLLSVFPLPGRPFPVCRTCAHLWSPSAFRAPFIVIQAKSPAPGTAPSMHTALFTYQLNIWACVEQYCSFVFKYLMHFISCHFYQYLLSLFAYLYNTQTNEINSCQFSLSWELPEIMAGAVTLISFNLFIQQIFIELIECQPSCKVMGCKDE